MKLMFEDYETLCIEFSGGSTEFNTESFIIFDQQNALYVTNITHLLEMRSSKCLINSEILEVRL